MLNSGSKHVIAGASAINTAGKYDGVENLAYHTLFVVAGTGVSAGVVAINVSADGVNWFSPASNSVTTSAAGTYSVTVGPIAARFAQAKITTGITGGTVDAWIAGAGA